MCNGGAPGMGLGLFAIGGGITALAPPAIAALQGGARRVNKSWRGEDTSARERLVGQAAAFSGRTITGLQTFIVLGVLALPLIDLNPDSFSSGNKWLLGGITSAATLPLFATVGNAIHECGKGESTYDKSGLDKALNAFDRWAPRLTYALIGAGFVGIASFNRETALLYGIVLLPGTIAGAITHEICLWHEGKQE